MGAMKVTCKHPDAALVDETRAGGSGKGICRWSAKRKRDAVLRLLRGEDLETLSRELGVTAARLSQWRDDFLAGVEAQLKARASIARDREVRELQRKLGELTMEVELLREKHAVWRRERRVSPGGGRGNEPAHISLRQENIWGAPRLPGLGDQPIHVLCLAETVAGKGGASTSWPDGPLPDEKLIAAIRNILRDSSFTGEGYRKIWARLRHQGIRTSKEQVRRLLGEHNLQAPTRKGSPRGPRNHGGTITTEAPNIMWGIDMTTTILEGSRQVSVFVAVDHCGFYCVGLHVAECGTRWKHWSLSDKESRRASAPLAKE